MQLPDLNLASTYIPACLCCLKSIFLVIIFLFIPQNEYIILASLLLFDRLIFNHNYIIIDVNAICFTALMCLIVNEYRHESVYVQWLKYGVFSISSLLSLLQITNITTLWQSVELMHLCMIIPVVLHVSIPDESYEIKCFRVLCFVAGNIITSYSYVYVQEWPPVYYIIISRTILIMLLDTYLFPVWTIFYITTTIVNNQYMSSYKKSKYTKNTEDSPPDSLCMTSSLGGGYIPYGSDSSPLSASKHIIHHNVNISSSTHNQYIGSDSLLPTTILASMSASKNSTVSTPHIEDVTDAMSEVQKLREALAKRNNATKV